MLVGFAFTLHADEFLLILFPVCALLHSVQREPRHEGSEQKKPAKDVVAAVCECEVV